ncbi:hypothetical protein RBU49_06955 [Clostridium sp. MB40-C1]|uniref:hypothetical protein n=1 Tax=Clostridium sp. MB40-C1 TaxID=3070996 RepID=UPI0027E067FD|nr:hypothetical protein [Clostridium sp. MB40-C1]WMJ81981.1 hypothetical protein RBU49_06955 [Clostridium sp. MB40-C1]
MKLYDILKNLIEHGRFEKEDMTKKLNVFYTFNQVTTEEYTELMQKVNPTLAENKTEEVKEKVVTQ